MHISLKSGPWAIPFSPQSFRLVYVTFKTLAPLYSLSSQLPVCSMLRQPLCPQLGWTLALFLLREFLFEKGCCLLKLVILLPKPTESELSYFQESQYEFFKIWSVLLTRTPILTKKLVNNCPPLIPEATGANENKNGNGNGNGNEDEKRSKSG